MNKTLVTFFGFWQVDADSFDRSLASSRGLYVLELRALAAMALRVVCCPQGYSLLPALDIP